MAYRGDVASVIERETHSTITRWLARVEKEPDIVTVHLTAGQRCAHLPNMFRDLVTRLRYPLPLGIRGLLSSAAVDHGMLRRGQGYSAAMMVEESRMLQVSIFETMHDNLDELDLSVLLLDVMAIGDEVDSQLAQAVVSFLGVAKDDDQHFDA